MYFKFCFFVKLPLRLRKRKTKRREEYLLNRGYELESSRVRYDADAEQRRASSKRWRQEKDSVAVRTSKRWRYEQNSDEKRASTRESLAREFLTNGTAANVTIVLLGNKLKWELQ